MSDRLESARKEVLELKQKIQTNRKAKKDTTLKDKKADIPALSPKPELKVKRNLKGHIGKIYAMHWCPEGQNIVSAAQDGNMLVWDAVSTNKLYAIPLSSAWVMTCAYSPSGQFVAAGGLNNVCTVYSLRSKEQPIKPSRELSSHTGYLSCCRFINDQEIVTSSGDKTLLLWDIEAGVKQSEFADHDGDVMSLSLSPTNTANVFVSGACDNTAKVWDRRTKSDKAQQTFTGHENDINSVEFFPSGNAFATGSDDTNCKLYDLRAYSQLMNYSGTNQESGVTSVAFSGSGRFLFCGRDDFNCAMFDTLTGELLRSLSGHDNRVSCIGVGWEGQALCTGSWDSYLKIWA